MMIDDTPERTKQYWMEQNPDYIRSLDDPEYQAEQSRISTARKVEMNPYSEWRKKLFTLDPSHPKAPVPDWVRWAKRKNQGFKCHILRWYENDWMVNKQSGDIQQVGILTLDHTIAAMHGGLTTDANTKMIAEIANLKKGSKKKTYDEMREFLHTVYELYVPTLEEIVAIHSFRDRGIKRVKL